MPSSRKVPLYSQRKPQPVSGRISSTSVSLLTAACAKSIRQTIRGRLYGYGSDRPRSVDVRVTNFSTTSGTRSFVEAEQVLGCGAYIHDCDLKSLGPRSTQRFRIFFTRHRRLPPNTAVSSTRPPSDWHGQLLVLRVTEDGKRHVTLKKTDTTLINRVLPRSGNQKIP